MMQKVKAQQAHQILPPNLRVEGIILSVFVKWQFLEIVVVPKSNSGLSPIEVKAIKEDSLERIPEIWLVSYINSTTCNAI